MLNRLQMREHTRRAVSDVCGIILANYGIVPSFHEVQQVAGAIDREMMRFGQVAKSMTPDEWAKAIDESPVASSLGDM